MLAIQNKPDNSPVFPLPTSIRPYEGQEPIGYILYLFASTVNPLISYANKTQRKAVAELIEKFTFEKVMRMTQYAISIQGEEYAPVITDPWTMKKKIGKLLVFYYRNQKKMVAQTKESRNYDN